MAIKSASAGSSQKKKHQYMTGLVKLYPKQPPTRAETATNPPAAITLGAYLR